MTPNTILALDLATQCGWAVGAPAQFPMSGSESLRSVSKHPGAKLCILIDWLAPMIQEHEPCRIIYEAALMVIPEGKTDEDGRRRGGNAKTLADLISMAKTVEMLACRWNLPVVQTYSQTVRKWFVGHGRPEEPKLAVQRECLRRGWQPRDDNAADALALLDYAHGQFFPSLYRRSYRT